MYTYKMVEERHYYVPRSMNDYVVTYKGKKISLDEYLITKECESVLDCNKSIVRKMVHSK